MPAHDRETATERDHARHELMRENLRLRHALSQSRHRARKLRGLYRAMVDDLRIEVATLKCEAERLRLENSAAYTSAEVSRRNSNAAHADWQAANLRALVAEGAACPARCPVRWVWRWLRRACP